jgi:MFS transporter, ACDE family, multidrug resistance protein
MVLRYIPLELRHAPAPKVQHFALLAGLEATVRGTLISVMPLVLREAMGSTLASSRVYFMVGVVSLFWGLMVPWVNRKVPRRWLYSVGVGLYLIGMALAMIGTPLAVAMALGASAMATATTFVCFNAYVLDYVDRSELGRGQSIQMLYAAGPWAVGPMLGVWLHSLWRPAPFLLAGALALVLLTTFWVLRLGNGRQIARARRPAVNPLAYLARFFRQPRLIAGWLFAVIRSTGWWVYVVYLPYFCIEHAPADGSGFASPDLARQVGGIALSFSNALLFVAPLILRLARRGSVRIAVRVSFALCAGFFALAVLLSPWPWATVACLVAASVFLVALDVVGGLPFLMAVKPSERTEMSAVYSSFRDVSSILTPGAAWAVLALAPTAAIFGVCAAGMGAAWTVAGRMHPRLGTSRPSASGQAGR